MGIEKFKLALSLLQAKFLKKELPIVVGWALTNRCTHRCRYCRRYENAAEDITTQEVLKVIDELSAMGTYKINFTGGEPFLREDLGDIIVYAKKKKIKVMISSNGELVAKRIDLLKYIDYLSISVEGREEIQDDLRGAGSYKEVLSACEAAARKGVKLFFSTVINRLNVGSLDQVLDLAVEVKAKVFFSVIDKLPLAARNMEELYPERSAYQQALDKLIEQKKKGNFYIGDSLPVLNYLKNWPEQNIPILCAAGHIYCRIESGGMVYRCAYLLDQEKALNCREVGFKKAFLDIAEKSKCSDCWCGSRIEMNYVLDLKLNSIWNILSSL